MPLRQAVFAFSMAEDTEIVEIGATPLPELAKILEDKSGACKAEIDPTRLVFLFHFYANRATIISGGAPWAILEQPRETTFNPDPQLEAEALFKANREQSSDLRVEVTGMWVRHVSGLVGLTKHEPIFSPRWPCMIPLNTGCMPYSTGRTLG